MTRCKHVAHKIVRIKKREFYDNAHLDVVVAIFS